MMKELIKKPVFWLGVYAFGISIALTVVSFKLLTKECEEVNIPEIQKEYVEKIKEITHADSNDVDSLLLELYGFESK